MKTLNPLFAGFLILVLASCSGTPDNSAEAKRKQLTAYKQELQTIQTKIARLEAELDSARKIEYVSVKTLDVVPRRFEHFFEVTGNVEADEEVNVSPESAGKIMDILVREGRQVKKGTVLATLNTDMLDQSIEETRISLELARTTFERQKNLWDQKIGSELQFLQAKSGKESLERRLESLQAQKEMTVIKSPVDGVVDVIFQKRGEIGSPQLPFAKVVNIQRLKVYGDIAETYLTRIRKGDQVTIQFPAISRSVTASVAQMGNYIDPNNRTFRVRIDLRNPDGLIKPNMVAVLKLRDYVSDSAIVVPTLIVKQDFKGSYTYTVTGSDSMKRASKVYVETGVVNNNMTEIIHGLNPGMKVISEGFDQVVDGSAVKI
ncbi:MAG: efflux RND transporter periplasmic adaptor subunit [Mangrovibacterium sp.]|nr:efflux RND transporter periplasmic adaptor subunit [Mangrovibacterium sp.]